MNRYVAVVWIAACGSPTPGADSPGGALGALHAAIGAHDGEAARAVLGSPAELARVLECPEGHGEIANLERARAELGRDLEDTTLTVMQLHERPRIVAVGQHWRQCVARARLVVWELSVDQRVVDHGEVFEAAAELDAILLDGRWYLLPETRD